MNATTIQPSFLKLLRKVTYCWATLLCYIKQLWHAVSIPLPLQFSPLAIQDMKQRLWRSNPLHSHSNMTVQHWSSDKEKKTFCKPVALLLSSKNQRGYLRWNWTLWTITHSSRTQDTIHGFARNTLALTVGIVQELGLWLQMTKWGNLIKYRICKSICAEDYKGSASPNPQSDISPNCGYINQRTRRTSLKRQSRVIDRTPEG